MSDLLEPYYSGYTTESRTVSNLGEQLKLVIHVLFYNSFDFIYFAFFEQRQIKITISSK